MISDQNEEAYVAFFTCYVIGNIGKNLQAKSRPPSPDTNFLLENYVISDIA